VDEEKAESRETEGLVPNRIDLLLRSSHLIPPSLPPFLPYQVTKAVIAVPAKFNARQKRATGEAYKRAGLKVMKEERKKGETAEERKGVYSPFLPSLPSPP
jgi:hypothetical protein